MGFGDFTTLCQHAAIPLCSMVGEITTIAGLHGIEADCYARNIELANIIMILHVRSKFTAVGTLSQFQMLMGMLT
jgi:hypothetical protein